MPLYDYLCRRCGHEFELLVMGNDQPSCPQCHGEELDKRMSGFSVRGGQAKTKAGAGAPASKCSGCGGGSCASCH
ncbi:MAG: zinc ribbon domain-containing protein [Desulfobacteraceae bacterium]|nr:zinc ribbon domain-containing protein [Desulfobacteraceae bacterium]